MRLEDNLNASGDFQTIADSIPQMVWVTRRDGYHELYNRRWYEYTGLTPDQSYGDAWSNVLHPDDAERTHALWNRSLATGDPYDVEYRFRRHDGVYRWFFGSARALRDQSGSIVRWYGTLTDIDDRVAAQRTLQFLLKASEALGGIFGTERTLEALARSIAPALADWCLVYLQTEDGHLELRTIGHADPELAERARSTTPSAAVIAALVDGESVGTAMTWQHSPGLLTADGVLLGIGQTFVIPLRAGGEPIGAVQLIHSSAERVATDDQRRVAEALAARASLALDNARLFERERQIASTFQKAALPATLPNVRGVVLDAAYQPASAEALVGGDWYDALQLRDGRVVISIGDVSGHGLAAAVTMQAMRQAVRTVAHVHADPVMILDAADRTLRSESTDRIVTAFVGIYDAVEGELRYALAGHPSPILRRADGELLSLDAPALPLGMRESTSEKVHTITLGHGDLVVLYTDGVVEATRDIFEGERRLAAAVAEVDATTREAAHHIVARTLPDGSSDDVAVLTFAIADPPETIGDRWSFASVDRAAANAVRAAFQEALARCGIKDETVRYAARIVFGELVANAVRHAPGPIDVVFEHAREPILHVLDRGPGFVLSTRVPVDSLAERGRGLNLVWSLTNETNVTHRTGGGAHVRAVIKTR